MFLTVSWEFSDRLSTHHNTKHFSNKHLSKCPARTLIILDDGFYDTVHHDLTHCNHYVNCLFPDQKLTIILEGGTLIGIVDGRYVSLTKASTHFAAMAASTAESTPDIRVSIAMMKSDRGHAYIDSIVTLVCKYGFPLRHLEIGPLFDNKGPHDRYYKNMSQQEFDDLITAFHEFADCDDNDAMEMFDLNGPPNQTLPLYY